MINLFKSVPTGEEIETIKDVLISGWWDMGQKVAELEEKWAKFTGAKYAVATNSCTSALDIAVRVADLGDIVTVSAFTFVSSALCILNAGKQVRFVDINEHNLCTVGADIQVCYAGNQCGSGTIYDMAHSGGAKHRGLISCWSFQARKNLPCGDGGMLTTNDEEIYRRAKALSWCGIDKSTMERSKRGYSWDYHIEELGIKGNMNDITASIALVQLKHLPERNEYRAKVASWYDKYLPKEIMRPFPSATWHMYTIRVKNRDMLSSMLAKAGIQTGVHYKPLYKYPIFPQTVMPITERVWKKIMTLPLHLEVTENDVKYICETINKYKDIWI